MDITQVNQAVTELHGAFHEIQQPRSDYALRHFVVGEKDTETMRYFQCVLELQIKYNAIRRAGLHRQKLEVEIRRLRASGDALADIEADEKLIDIEDLDLAYTGALREFECLYRIWQSFPHQYAHEELEMAQEAYWHARLIRQAEQDIEASGRIAAGNLDALRQAGLIVHHLPEGRRFYAVQEATPLQLDDISKNGGNHALHSIQPATD